MNELKVLANPLRLSILRELAKEPSYPKQLAKKLKVAEQLVYYHVRRLEAVGLIKVEGLEGVRGAVAKRYGVPFNGLLFKLKDPALPQWRSPPEALSSFVEQGVVIVVGSPDVHGPFLARARDQHLAVKLSLLLGLMGAADVDVKLDTEVSEADLQRNLVCLGGPAINTLTWRLNRELPIYFNFERENQIVSRISGRVYGEDVNGVVEVLKSPFAEGRRVVVLAGRRIEGTRASVVAFTQRLNEVEEGNVYNRSVIAKVVEGIDRDSDGLIDDVVFLE